MNSRVSVWAILACVGVVPGCFETKVITANGDAEGGKSGSSGSANFGGNSGAGGAASAAFNGKACLACEDAHCASEAEACKGATGCNTYLGCLFGCSSNASCTAKCVVTDVNAASAAVYLASCAVQYCSGDCVNSDTSLGGSGGGSAGNGGKASAGGKASVSEGGSTNATGGSATQAGGSLSFGGSVSGGGGQASSGITWLTFDGSAAPATLAPNTDLGIDGIMYGYGDGCASLSWDETTRCATGMLCSPGPTFANWGAGVGFDFRNTGKDGVPPKTKHTWNPSDYGVRGIAWEITGTAPALQLWVLNMDPSYHGECSDSMTCDIAGPPDGSASPELSGQLLFSNMRKDDWGGSGIIYTFDPAAVHALQFKLPAVIAGAAPFSFCVNRVGLIR